jgi:hypothetical protein
MTQRNDRLGPMIWPLHEYDPSPERRRLRRSLLIAGEHLTREARLRELVAWMARQHWIVAFGDWTDAHLPRPVLWAIDHPWHVLTVAWGAFVLVVLAAAMLQVVSG